MMWHDLFTALALLLVLEGIFPFVHPGGLKKTMLLMGKMTDHQLRFAGITSMLVGLVLLYLVN